MRLSKGIIRVIFANIVNLIISIGNGFLLPKYLSIEAYAGLKMFLLYISYVGVLHLGYIDGIYIKYGGKASCEINPVEMSKDKRALAVFQLIITFFIAVVAIAIQDVNLFLVGISILPVNMITFYKFVYQATGEFSLYSRITNVIPIIIFALNLILLFGLRNDNAFYYALMQVGANYVVWIYYERKNKLLLIERIADTSVITRIKENIWAGAVIMLGNFMGIWITSIDRWFVKFFCSVEEFAYYAFAVTMLRLLNVVITAFSVTLYNFFCLNHSSKDVEEIRKYVLIIGAVLIIMIFPLKYVIFAYLPHYGSSFSIIQILFAAQFVMIEINSVYTNLYKALNQQKKYLRQMLIITVIAVLTNVVLGVFCKFETEAFAIATMVTAFIWLIVCQIELQEYVLSKKEWVYLILIAVLYFFSGKYDALTGGMMYVGLCIMITMGVFFEEIKIVAGQVKTILIEKNK